MVEMVCLHVISLMEALQECNSTIFVKVCSNSSVTLHGHINMQDEAKNLSLSFLLVNSYVATHDSVKP